MLHWEALFQIPNSGSQSRDVYAIIDSVNENNALVKFYADVAKETFLFELEFEVSSELTAYDDLLANEYFVNYTKLPTAK